MLLGKDKQDATTKKNVKGNFNRVKIILLIGEEYTN